MCSAAIPADHGEVQWLQAPQWEHQWPGLFLACLNRLTPASCGRLTSLLTTLTRVPPVSLLTLGRLTELMYQQIVSSSLYAPQYAAVGAALSQLRCRETPGVTFLSLTQSACETTALSCSASAVARRNCASFLGQLLAHSAVPAARVLRWADQLEADGSEAAVDTLCSMLAAAGPCLDYRQLQLLMARLKWRLHLPATSCRTRCLILDLLELQACFWQPRAPLTPVERLQLQTASGNHQLDC